MAELDPRLQIELRDIIDNGLASGEFLTRTKIDEAIGRFRSQFDPARIRDTDGEALLRLMHGREDAQARSLAYRLEFRTDDELSGSHFGGIGGGTALKFGIYQRKEDGEWMSGTAQKQVVLTKTDAIELVRQQRNELLAGEAELAQFPATDVSDSAYARLQKAIERAAPTLYDTSWAHKYWFLIHPDKLDDFHSPRYQRFHIFKMLQVPPDGTGLLVPTSPRFVCAGRFVSAARQLGVPVNTLTSALVKRDGGRRRYWRIGTTAGDSGESQWPAMRAGGFVSIGWPSEIPNLSKLIGQKGAKEQVRTMLASAYDDAGTATRKAGEVMKFAEEMEEGDLVLACQGQRVLGVGRVSGSYGYDHQYLFPHTRPVDWLLLEPWDLPDAEGLRTTVCELGKHPQNILEVEQRIFQRKPIAHNSILVGSAAAAVAVAKPLPTLGEMEARIDSILKRKGQVILYGPPGTGKTYSAVRAARELAARRAFRTCVDELSSDKQNEIDGPSGLVRICTFHAGYGYEDFIEGFRPRVAGNQMTFELRDGIFKTLCKDARQRPEVHFFLVVDEINRGDLPRIFGELMTVIELDKRDLPITLPLSNATFAVPPNVFVIGTMNTADRSISLLDTALRRRFGFVELMPNAKPLDGLRVGGISFGPWLEALNARVRRYLKRDARNLQVGHAYLLPSQRISSMAEFAKVLRDDIIPLLEEYCYDDFETLRSILGDEIVDSENGKIREEIFESTQEDRLISALTFEEMQQPVEPIEPVSADGVSDEDADSTS